MGGWYVGERVAGAGTKDVSHVLERGVGEKKRRENKNGRGKGTNAGCSFFLGKINLSRGAWGEIVGDDSVDFVAKGLNGDYRKGEFFSSV